MSQNNTPEHPSVRVGDPQAVAEAREVASNYHPLGPNHVIRVNGVAYFYEPADDLWHRGSTPIEHMGLPYSITAETIHDWTLNGPARITTWDADQ